MYAAVIGSRHDSPSPPPPPPHQVGDAKEPVRKGVHALFRELCSFFPPAKLFGFLLDGLKSKNARQRTGERSSY